MAEKTEEATPKRKEKARKDGDVAKSGEFTGVAVMVAALATLGFSAASICRRLVAFLLKSIELAMRPDVTASVAGPFLMEGLRTLALILAPLLAAIFAIAAFISYIQVGAIFTVKPLIPDPKKLNPASGFKNLFSKTKLVELIKNVLKLTVMGAMGYEVVMEYIPQLLRTPRVDLFQGVMVFRVATLKLTVVLVGGLIAFGIFDLVWQRHSHRKKLMMSKDDIKREHKESEGDPHVKGKRKQLQRKLLREAGMRKVKDADAVVVNPTHVAVALRYRDGEMTAPKVIAAGKGEIARKIKKLARRYQIPIVRNVELAHALVELNLEQAIPEELYEAVAEVLRFVYSLREENV